MILSYSIARAGSVSGTVDPAYTKGGALVYVKEVPGKTFAPPPVPLVVEQRDQKFSPHVLPILRGTQVRFPNRDRVRHSVFSPSSARPFNFGIYPPGEDKSIVFDQLGVAAILCTIHEDMSAYILVLQNPYFAAPAADGRFTLEGVPDGTYTLVLWHEKLPALTRTVQVKGAVRVEFK
jgi:plastocyanin